MVVPAQCATQVHTLNVHNQHQLRPHSATQPLKWWNVFSMERRWLKESRIWTDTHTRTAVCEKKKEKKAKAWLLLSHSLWWDIELNPWSINCKNLTDPLSPLVTETINVFWTENNQTSPRSIIIAGVVWWMEKRSQIHLSPHYLITIAEKTQEEGEKSVTRSCSEAGWVCGLRSSELIRISPLRPTAPTMLVCGLGAEFLRVSREWAGNTEGLDSPLQKSAFGSQQSCGRHTAYWLSTGLCWLTVF